MRKLAQVILMAIAVTGCTKITVEKRVVNGNVQDIQITRYTPGTYLSYQLGRSQLGSCPGFCNEYLYFSEWNPLTFSTKKTATFYKEGLFVIISIKEKGAAKLEYQASNEEAAWGEMTLEARQQVKALLATGRQLYKQKLAKEQK